MSSPWLIVGLGNPGPEHVKNRHNVGFMAVERFADRHTAPGTGGVAWKSQFKGRVSTVRVANGGASERCVVLEPQTYMNCSGESVRAAVDYHDVALDRIVIVHDEIDFDFGQVEVKRGGGHGGHNGLRDIIKHLGKPSFTRVRVGVGRPRHGEVSSWVLANFSGEDASHLGDLIDRAEQALSHLLTEGLTSAKTLFNRSSSPNAAAAGARAGGTNSR